MKGLLRMVSVRGALLVAALLSPCGDAAPTARYVVSPQVPEAVFVEISPWAVDDAVVSVSLVDGTETPASTQRVEQVVLSRRDESLLIHASGFGADHSPAARLWVSAGKGRHVSLPAPPRFADRQYFDILLLVDDSHSMRKTDPERRRVDAIKTFAARAAGHPRVRTLAIAAFTYDAKLLLPPTSSHALPPLDGILEGLKAGGRTDMDAGLALAIRTLQGTSASRKVIVVLSDGKDAPGRYEETHEHCRRLGMAVHTIGLSELADVAMLSRIAKQTGGAFHRAATAADLDAAFSAVAEALERPVLVDEVQVVAGEGAAPELVLDRQLRGAFVTACASEGAQLVLVSPSEGATESGGDVFRLKGARRLRVPLQVGMWPVALAAQGDLPGAAVVRLYGNSKVHLLPFPVTRLKDGRLRVEVLVKRVCGVGVRRVGATLRWPGGERVLALRDDGEAPDGVAGDGLYGGNLELPSAQVGPLVLSLRAVLDDEVGGGTISRMVVSEIEHRADGVVQPVRRVDGALRRTIAEMFDLMYEAKGIGLAANQVDLPLRLFVINPKSDPDEKDQEQVFRFFHDDTDRGISGPSPAFLSFKEVAEFLLWLQDRKVWNLILML